ncbi:MAG: NADP oxidoreductase, partial [Anaerolineae bacterium]|nr:NADP oxidoreductase [Anaerolineae bacterium]
SVETVEMLLEDARAGKLLNPAEPEAGAVEELLHQHHIRYVTYSDWLVLDRIEQERGAARNAPRLKFSRVDEMLDAIADHKTSAVSEAIPGD